MSRDDVSQHFEKLTKLLEAQNKALNARIDALERKVGSSGGGARSSFPLTLAVVFVAVALGFILSGSNAPLAIAARETAANFKTDFINWWTEIDAFKCQTLTIYRYGQLKKYNGKFFNKCEASQAQIIEAANNLFPSPDRNISRLLSMTGRDLPEYISTYTEPFTVLSLSAPDRELFMWPIVKIGHTVDVEVGEEKQKVSVKTLAGEPRVFELQNLLTKDECDHFYNLAIDVQGTMDASMVGADHKTSTKSDARSSKHTWIGSIYEDGSSGQWKTSDIVERVEKRIFDLTRLTKNTAEPFQVVFYNMSDYYYGHHDFTQPEYAPNNPYFRGGGNRYITVLLYLNDVEEGGHTAFPFADANGNPQNRHMEPISLYQGSTACDLEALKVHPRKGGAAMFYNLQENGHMNGAFDKWTVHAGCKPLKGPKYISNKWIRNKRVNGHLYDEVW